jgi:hypothetical protein
MEYQERRKPSFFEKFALGIVDFFKAFGMFFVKLYKAIVDGFIRFGKRFLDGSIGTKLSYFCFDSILLENN